MKVEIKVDPNVSEPTAVIVTPKLTPDILLWMEMLEGTTETENPNNALLVAKNDDKLFVLDPAQVELVRVEGGDVMAYNQKGQAYLIPKPLHEVHDKLGAAFVRIAKSVIINIQRVDHLSPSFNGTMCIVMKNGVSDYISRKYLGDFKRRLGL